MQRVRAALAPLDGLPAAVAGAEHDVGVVRVDQLPRLRRSAVGDQQRDVAVLEGGEVRDHGVGVVGALDEHQAAGRPQGVPGKVACAVGELGIADLSAGGVDRSA